MCFFSPALVFIGDENSIQRLLPEAEVILTFHYAHREGIYREDQEMTRVRQLLSCVDCTRIHLA